jgi:hypothetical protein
MLLLVISGPMLAHSVRPIGKDPDEFVLLTGPSFSNLNSTSAETPPSLAAPAPHSYIDHGKADISERALFAALPEPASVAEPLLLPVVQLEIAEPELPVTGPRPAAENCYQVHHLGETPMMQTWKLLGLNAVVAVTLAAGPSRAVGQTPPTNSEKLDAIQKQLDEMKKSLTGMHKSLGALKAIETELQNLRNESNAGAAAAQKDVNELRAENAKMREEIEALRARISATTRIAASPPSESVPLAATARVELINTYFDNMTVILNGKSYRLPPGERWLTNPLPAGSFTYEVLGVTPQRTRVLTANQVYPIHIHPQP